MFLHQDLPLNTMIPPPYFSLFLHFHLYMVADPPEGLPEKDEYRPDPEAVEVEATQGIKIHRNRPLTTELQLGRKADLPKNRWKRAQPTGINKKKA